MDWKIAYEFELSEELVAVHLVFHVFVLKKCMDDPSFIIAPETERIVKYPSFDHFETFESFTVVRLVYWFRVVVQK